mgnify:CR=1 FL=1
MGDAENLRRQLDQLSERLRHSQTQHRKDLAIQKAKWGADTAAQIRKLEDEVVGMKRQWRQSRNSQKRAEELLWRREAGQRALKEAQVGDGAQPAAELREAAQALRLSGAHSSRPVAPPEPLVSPRAARPSTARDRAGTRPKCRCGGSSIAALRTWRTRPSTTRTSRGSTRIIRGLCVCPIS